MEIRKHAASRKLPAASPNTERVMAIIAKAEVCLTGCATPAGTFKAECSLLLASPHIRAPNWSYVSPQY